MAADPSTICPFLIIEAFIHAHHDLEPEVEPRPEERISIQKANRTLCRATSLQFGRAVGQGGQGLCLEMGGKDFIESIDFDLKYCFSFELRRSTRAACTGILPFEERLSYNFNLGTFSKGTFYSSRRSSGWLPKRNGSSR